MMRAAPTLGNPELQLGPSSSPLPSPANLGWYRRFLPHRDDSGLIQFITYRLADSLPQAALDRLESELAALPPERMEPERRRRIEAWLDAGHGSCVLRDPAAAQIVVEAWRHFDGERYDLLAWVVMPNHVHVLVRVHQGKMLWKIVQSWKSFTGRRILEVVDKARAGARGSQECSAEGRRHVWMREYWDRFIRDEAHLMKSVEYIHQNPSRAGLVVHPEDWPWSSAAAAFEKEGGFTERFYRIRQARRAQP
jgi:REP element-mobilizing transposase RayT